MRIGLLGSGLHDYGWSPITKLLEKLKLNYKIHTNHNQLDEADHLVISVGYNRILPKTIIDSIPLGFVVFHSTDLPKGRGWAPLFYTRFLNQNELVLTMFYANEEVDAGNIIAKSRYPIDERYNIEELRKIDNSSAMILLEQYLPIISKRKYEGTKQTGTPSFHAKRKPSESQLNSNKTITEQINLIKALPPEYPGFFINNGIKEFVKIKQENIEPFELSKLIIKNYLDLK